MKKLLLLSLVIHSQLSYSTSDFQRIVTLMLQQDPDFQAVNNQAEAQKTALKSAKSQLWLPELTLSHSQNKSESSQVFKEDIGQSNQDYKLSSLSLNYTLFSFGSDYANYKSSKMQYNSYLAEKKLSLLQQEEVTITLLLKYILASNNYKIQEEIYTIKKRLLTISQRRFKRGALSRSDLLKIEIDLANAESVKISAEKSLSQANILLAPYFNQALPALNFPWKKKFNKKNISKILNYKYDFLQRANLQKLRLEEKSATQQTKAFQRNHWGKISLNYARTLEHREESNDLYGYSTSIMYTLPIFESYRTQREIEQAKAKQVTAKSFYQFERKSLKIQEELIKKDLRLEFLNYKNRMSILKTSSRLNKNSINQFKRGKLSVNDLLTEQNRLLTTKVLSNEANYNMHLDYLRMLHFYEISITTNNPF